MIQHGGAEFDPAFYLANAGPGRRIVHLEAKQNLFSQGDPADSIFYLQSGQAKITVVSKAGKEATVTVLAAGDFAGEESLTATHGLRLATVTAITACSTLKIDREEMIRIMHEENVFSDLFLMSEISKTGEPEQCLPKISQETLAEMVGTTRSRVSFFMNRFRKLGFIDYSDRIQVHKSLLNVVLHDQLPGDRIEEASVLDSHQKKEKFPD